jgi:excisionase family DNA binding protein
MSDAADRLAKAIRDLIGEAVQAAAERQSVQQPPAPQAPRQRLITIAEARQELGGISPTTFYQLVKDGELRVVKIGRRTFVAVSELDKYICRQIAN